MGKMKVFKSWYNQELKDNVETNMQFYQGNNDVLPNIENGVLISNLEVNDNAPVLLPGADNDMDNAIKVFEFLSIDETVASDPRLWSYLTHVTFKDYTVSRWSIDASASPKKNVDKILDRWFTSGNARSLRRNALSRLWWSVRLTVAPWDNDAEYFTDLKDMDRYKYTRVLMEKEDLTSAIIERPQLSSSQQLLIAILEYFRMAGEDVKKRDFYREFLKEVVLTLGYRKIMVLDLSELLSELDDIGIEIKRRRGLVKG